MEVGKYQTIKVTLASPIQNLWFISFDRSSGQQIHLTVEPSRNSEDDNQNNFAADFAATMLRNFLFKWSKLL